MCGGQLITTTSKDEFDWRCDETMGGGVLNTIGSNIIDLITYLTGQKAVRVHGMLKTYTKQTDKIKGIREITSDDFCSIQLELDLDQQVPHIIHVSLYQEL
jgi:predicted dehydrogenase